MRLITDKNFISKLCFWILAILLISSAMSVQPAAAEEPAAEMIACGADSGQDEIRKSLVTDGQWDTAVSGADAKESQTQAAETDAEEAPVQAEETDAKEAQAQAAGTGAEGTTDALADGETAVDEDAPAALMGVGQMGEDVSFVQEMLNILGYSTGDESGTYGEMTEKSVRAFQKDHELYIDGLVGPITMAALIDETYKNPDQYTGLVQMPTSGRWAFVCNGVYTDDPSEMVLTTEDEEAGLKEEFCEVYAKNVVERITTPEMTEEEKIDACFQFTLDEFESTNHPRVPHYTGSDWVYVYAYDMFGPRHGGNCFSYAAAFSVLAKACGIEEVYCCTSGAHAWTEIEGLVYDPEQYHDTDNNKIYAYSYSNAAISNYWPAISDWEEYPWMRMKLPAFS